MIDGVSSDLEARRVATFDELYRYCYQVASVVGLTIVHIFEFEDPRALELAEKCGIAFQLTNIIRDVKEDEALGRVYLPAEDLHRFGVTTPFENGPAFVDLIRFEAGRARDYYAQSAPLVDMVSPATRRSLWALIRIYARLLERIEQSGYAVLNGRIRLPASEKMAILAKAWIAGPR
jgi:phytoene synthase